MITEALQHCRGVGEVRLSRLHQAGVRTWHDALTNTDLIPDGLRQAVVEECQRSLTALSECDIRYFTDRLCPADRWRILHEYLDRATYFDIETTGLNYDDTITVIACRHKGELLTFVEHENLDDFLDLLDDVELLLSFNGSSFDIPRLLDTFHIPELPCAHLDLRWLSYHSNLHGGLKQITFEMGLKRPDDLRNADGDLAIELWSRWRNQQDESARRLLLRYCAADVLLLEPLARHLARRPEISVENLWHLLPAADECAAARDPVSERRQALEKKFGPAGPTKLRMLRNRAG